LETKIIKIDPIKPELKKLGYCAKVIKSGGLVAFPTETVYGLGACVYLEDAVKKIFKAKNRPLDNPLIVHISNLEQLKSLVKEIPEKAQKLINEAWPGPLTLIFKKNNNVSYIVTGGLETVAIRMPAHPVALKLIELSNCPIAAPSANIAGRPSPTNPKHVIEDLFGKIDIIIDAGDTFFGVESTIINIATDPPVLLRPGPLPVEKIKEFLNEDIIIPDFAKGLAETKVAMSPGTKYRHYSPSKPLILVETSNYSGLDKLVRKAMKLCKEFRKKKKKVLIIASDETKNNYMDCIVVSLGPRSNLYEVAKNLYKTLRLIDELDVDVAIVEGFEERGIGLAIMNRLRKASGMNIIKV